MKAHRLLVTACLALAFPAGISAQEPAPDSTLRALPAGVRINSLGSFSGVYSLIPPGAGGTAGGPAVWLYGGGVTADVSWIVPGRRSTTSLNYQGSYSANQRFDALNGSDHAVELLFRTNSGRRTTYAILLAGESRLISSVLLGTARTLTAAQQATSLGELAAGLGDAGPDLAGSPLELLMSGARRNMGTVHLGVARSHSSRVTSQYRAGLMRDLRSTSSVPALTSSYPSVTLGMADASLTYSSSRQTRVTLAGTYARSYSALYRFDTESATVAVEHEFGRRSFGRAEGGYGRAAFLGPARPGRNGYNVAGSAGTRTGNHTLVASFRRGVADLHGLAADTTLAVEGVWTWSRPRSPWSGGASLGYERLEGLVTGALDAWVFRASAVRRITAHVELMFDTAYANLSLGNLTEYARRGVRISLVWRPEGIRRPRS